MEKFIIVAIFNILAENIKYGDDIFFILAENNWKYCGVGRISALRGEIFSPTWEDFLSCVGKSLSKCCKNGCFAFRRI